jgi:monovalent cation:H+ antiporter, CPA1 family
MQAETALMGLLVIAVAVAIVVRRFRLPYTVALVVAGLVLGAMRPMVPSLEALYGIRLSPDVLFAILLPGLLYEAAFHISLKDLRRNWRTIGLLAVPGVILSAAVTGLIVWGGAAAFGLTLPLLAALLFGALISATDPISVLAMLKELGVGRRLRMAMEGESLLNDGLAVVMFGVLAGLLGLGAHGEGHVDAAWVTRLLLWEVGVGVLIGVGLGAVQSFVTSRVDDHLVELTMTTVVAFGSYLVADGVHASGVIAVVAAGLCSGNYGGRLGMSPTTRVAVVSMWEYVTFVANSVVFLLIGLEIDLVQLASRAHLILGAWLAVLVARAVAIWALVPLLKRSTEKVPSSWKPVLWWGGLHGALSMVLALSLPETFPHRALIVDLTFGTVLLCILVQGFSIQPLLKRLGLSHVDPTRAGVEVLRGRLLAARAALAELERRHAEGPMESAVYDSLRDETLTEIAHAEKGLYRLGRKRADQVQLEMLELHRDLLMTERDAILHAHVSGTVGDEALRHLLRGVDERLENLEPEE